MKQIASSKRLYIVAFVFTAQLWGLRYLDEHGGTGSVYQQLEQGKNVFPIHASLRTYRWEPENQALQK